MKKSPIIAAVVSLGIIGGGYLGGMYYLSGKTMSFLHAQVDKLNTVQGVHAEVQNEQRGLFTSHATVNIAAEDTVYNMPLAIHHGFFNTAVDSPSLAITEHGKNIFKASGAERDAAVVTAHFNNAGVIHETFKGSTVDIVLPGKLKGNSGRGDSVEISNPALRLERSSDGQLTLSARLDEFNLTEASGDSSHSGAFSASLTYDTEWLDNLIQAVRAYQQAKNVQNLQATQRAVFARLPDVHIDVKALDVHRTTMFFGPQQVAADSFTLDVTRDQSAAVTRLSSALTAIQANDVKGSASLKLALDQSVIDAYLKMSVHAYNGLDDLVALAKTSPRLVLEELRLPTGQATSLSATGEAHVDGQSIHSTADFSPNLIVANATINGLPAKLAEQLGINSVKPDQPIVVKLVKGHVTVNDKPMF